MICLKQFFYRVPLMIFAWSIVLLSTLSCGKKTPADVTLTLLPTQPIVFNAPYTDPNTGQAISPPWTSFRLKVKNNSATDTITIISIKGTLTPQGQTTSTGTGTGTSSGAGSSTNGTQFAIQSPVATIPYLVQLAPNAEQALGFVVYVSGLTQVDTLRYQGNLTAMGWYGTSDTPTKNLGSNNTLIFSTSQ